MLSPKTIEIIQATTPKVAAVGPDFTKHFYNKMLTNNPELKNIFNLTHQKTGSQANALFAAVAAAATNINSLQNIAPAVDLIAHKHCSLGVVEEQYAIVGKNILETIQDLFNPPQEVIDAWAEFYGVLQNIFVSREKELYEANASQEGGWAFTREFKVIGKEPEGEQIYKFTFEPVDGKSVQSYKPGQYTAIYVKPEGSEYQQIRQYSLVEAPNNKTLSIGVKKDGLVSSYLHDKVQLGDVVKLASPYGVFTLKESDVAEQKPLVFISGGVGQTPLLAMLDSLIKQGSNQKVMFVHSTQNANTRAFASKMVEAKSKLANFKEHLFYSQATEDGDCFKAQRIKLKDIADITLDNTQYYICGPVEFMQDMAKQLLELGVAKTAINYEVFGPHKVI